MWHFLTGLLLLLLQYYQLINSFWFIYEQFSLIVEHPVSLSTSREKNFTLQRVARRIYASFYVTSSLGT